jgi:hypothetical protein
MKIRSQRRYPYLGSCGMMIKVSAMLLGRGFFHLLVETRGCLGKMTLGQLTQQHRLQFREYAVQVASQEV